MSFYLYYLLLFFFSLFDNCLNSYHNIYIPFRTKNLRLDYENEINEDIEEDNYDKINAYSFLNKWFYNGIYCNIKINCQNYYIKDLKAFINFDNSNFSISKCDQIKQSFSETITKSEFINSNTLKIKEMKNATNKNIYKLGNLYASFYDNQNYGTTIYVNEQYNGLDFIYDDYDINDNDKLCGYIGLNINDSGNINIIDQLKKKKIISKYIWTLDYQTLSQGIIVFGTEPHFYDSNRYFYSQYKTIYANLNINKKIWSFNFDKINLKGTDIQLKNQNCELLIDQVLIIGTEEYKNIIEQIFFNILINEGICFKEKTKLNVSKELFNEYFIYYCDKIKFKGDFNSLSSIKESPFNKFNDIYLYQKGFEYIFKMRKEILFEEIGDKVYFLIIFDTKNNKIWKLGEPFISEYKLIFNHEQKTIGFYNPLLEKKPNSEYDFDNLEDNGDNKNAFISSKNYKIQSLFKNLTNILLILVAIFVIIYLIRKILMRRKLRANELVDNYEYLPNKNTKIINNSFEIK